jgi:hypothetical protein
LKKELPSCLSSSACRFDAAAPSAAGDIPGGPCGCEQGMGVGGWIGVGNGTRFVSGSNRRVRLEASSPFEFVSIQERQTRREMGCVFGMGVLHFDCPRAKFAMFWITFADTFC